jgi:peroxiredoxin
VTLIVGQTAPDFSLRNQHRDKVGLESLRGTKSTIVFIPFAFTRTCEGELCEIRDNSDLFANSDTKVVAITCNTLHANRVWADQQGFEFDILSDFWPHGEVARDYEAFDENYGYAMRTTYVLDSNLVVTAVITSDELGVARQFFEYEDALSS